MVKELGIAKLVLQDSQGLDDLTDMDHTLAQTACLYSIAVSLDQISEGLNRLNFKLDHIDQDLKNISKKLN